MPCSSPTLLRVRGLATAALPAALAAFALALACWPAQAQWKWREGKDVKYSDRPPPAFVKEQDILLRPAAPRTLPPPPAASAASAAVAAVPAAARASDPTLESRKRLADEQEAARRQGDDARLARQRAENCQRARDYARTLESGVRVGKLDANGEPAILDDRGRTEELALARRVIANDCK